MNLLPQSTSAPSRPFLGALRPRRDAPQTTGIPDGPVSLATLRRDARYRRLLGVADLMSVALALTVGVVVLGDGDQLNLATFAALPLVVLVAKAMGLYDRDEQLLHKSTLEEVPALFELVTLSTLVFWLGGEFFVNGELGRDQVLSLWGLLLLTMPTGRSAARWVARRGTSPERCLVIGNAAVAAQIAKKFAHGHGVAADPVGRVPLVNQARFASNGGSANGNGHSLPVLGNMDTLGLVLVEYEVDRAIIAPGPSDAERILDVIRLVRSLGVKVSVLPRLFEVVGSAVDFDEIEGTMLLGLRRDGLSKSSRMLKRGLDVVGSMLLLFALLPLLVIVAIAVKATSPGPVLFRQDRIGRRGQAFKMIKFRTMADGADERKHEFLGRNETDGLFKIADDPRLTRVGRFLRRSSLDELPQLWNVLRGEMSLVGPRPLVPDEDRQVEGWDRRRLSVTPGMTGPWQVFGPTRTPLQEMVKIDYVYAANWSLWSDVKIMLRTVPHMLGRRGL